MLHKPVTGIINKTGRVFKACRFCLICFPHHPVVLAGDAVPEGVAVRTRVVGSMDHVHMGVAVVVDYRNRVHMGMPAAVVAVDYCKNRAHRGKLVAVVVVDCKDRAHMGKLAAVVVAVDGMDQVNTVVQADIDGIADVAEEHRPVPKDGSHHLQPLNCEAQQTVPQVMHTYMD